MKYGLFVLLLGIVVAGANANARDSVCETAAECRSLLFKIDERIKALLPEVGPLPAAAAINVGDVSSGASCATHTECRRVLFKLDQRIGDFLKGERPGVGDLVTEQIWTAEMSFRDAVSYCKSKGSRLPTIRELALATAAEGGARGVIETAYPARSVRDPALQAEIRKMEAASYQAVYKPNRNGIAFYFDKTGYRMPPSLRKGNSEVSYPIEMTWSSSGSFDAKSGFIYQIDPNTGEIGTSRNVGSVRCVL